MISNSEIMEKKGRHELCLYMEQLGTLPYFTTERYDELDGYYYNPCTGDIVAFELKKRAANVNNYPDYIIEYKKWMDLAEYHFHEQIPA